MTAQGEGPSARAWDITISCPRPQPRVSKSQQAWHLVPERMQRAVETFFPVGSSLTLTARTVRLRTQVTGRRLGDYPDAMERTLASLLQCLYFETGHAAGGSLPRPVRFTIVEQPAQIPPSERDEMT